MNDELDTIFQLVVKKLTERLIQVLEDDISKKQEEAKLIQEEELTVENIKKYIEIIEELEKIATQLEIVQISLIKYKDL